MTDEMLFANARLVLPEGIVTGCLRVRDGKIAEIETGAGVPAGALDCEGDTLAPGLIELHTDNLERHIAPRPKVEWPHAPAIIAHDAELASTGITTVFDALRVGSIPTGLRTEYARYARPLADEILGLRAQNALKISHFLHLRAEICSATLIDELAEFGADDRVRIVSLMDHMPGQRQFADISKYRDYLTGKHGLSLDAFDAHVATLYALHDEFGARHEAAAVTEGRRLGAVLASHDDATEAQVAASAAHGVRLAEFPTTAEAARASGRHGIAVMMGAPNLVRGGSHSGNVAAGDLAADGLLDVISSDYVPASLLLGALRLGEITGDLHRGLAAVTSAPAAAVGLTDRGRLSPGLRADLIRLRLGQGYAGLRGVWVAGQRVA